MLIKVHTDARVRRISPGVILWRGVVCLGWLGRGPGKHSSSEEEMLKCVEFAFELDDIDGSILCVERLFDLMRDLRMLENPVVGSFGFIVASGEFASSADFFLEFHDGQKEVGVETESGVERVQKV